MNRVRSTAGCALLGALATALAVNVYGADSASAVAGRCLVVPANQEWMSTGIHVTTDQFVCVAGEGLWSHGGQGVEVIFPYYGPDGYSRDNYPENPDDPNPVLRLGALVGRIGDNYPFLIREKFCFIPKESGELRLEMNDGPGTFGNNDGFLKVQVQVRSAWDRPHQVKMTPEFCPPK